MPSRRKLLALAATGAVGAGAVGSYYDSGIQSTGQFTSQEAVFTEQRGSREDLFRADVFDRTSDAREALNVDIFEAKRHEDVLEFDDDSQFLAVLVSRSGLFPPDVLKGPCPEGIIDGDRFVFQVPVTEQNFQPSLQEERIVVIEVWNQRFTSAPSSGAVDVRILPDDTKERTCLTEEE